MDLKFEYSEQIIEGSVDIENIKSKSESEWLLELRFSENGFVLPLAGCFTINRVVGEDPYITAKNFILSHVAIIK